MSQWHLECPLWGRRTQQVSHSSLWCLRAYRFRKLSLSDSPLFPFQCFPSTLHFPVLSKPQPSLQTCPGSFILQTTLREVVLWQFQAVPKWRGYEGCTGHTKPNWIAGCLFLGSGDLTGTARTSVILMNYWHGFISVQEQDNKDNGWVHHGRGTIRKGFTISMQE